MAVYVDLLDGERARKVVTGYEFDRIAIVTGLTGDGHTRSKAAIDAVVAVVGDVGDAHPLDPGALIDSFDSEAVSIEEVKVTVVYRQPQTGSAYLPNTQWSVGTSVRPVESNKNADDEPIVLEYTYPANYELDPQKAGQTHQQGGMVQIPKPQTTFTARRREVGSPGTKAKQFVGKGNQSNWSIDPTAPARTWLCSRIHGQSADGGITYDVEYVFEYREETWDELVVFINPDTGRPPPDLVDGVGVGLAPTVKEADFDLLAL